MSRVAVTRLVRRGKLQRITWGVYAPADFQPTEHHGLTTAATRV